MLFCKITKKYPNSHIIDIILPSMSHRHLHRGILPMFNKKLPLGHFQANLHGTRLIASFEGKDTKDF